MRKNQNNFKFLTERLDNMGKHDMLINMGVRTHATSGSRTVNTADFRYFLIADALYFFAGLREWSCESMTGTTCCVFLTPYQARSFFALKKARKSDKGNDRTTRRSPHAGSRRLPLCRTDRRRFTAVDAGRASCRAALHPSPPGSAAHAACRRTVQPDRLARAHYRVTGGLLK